MSEMDSDQVHVLARRALDIAGSAPSWLSATEDKRLQMQEERDVWLVDVRRLEVPDQVRLVAQLLAFGDKTGFAMASLREAVLAQLQASHAENLARAATSLSWVGIAVAALSAVAAFLAL